MATLGDALAAVKSDPGPHGPVTDQLLAQVAGPIPLKIVAARILRSNPTLSPKARYGSLGGLAMTSVPDAVARNLNVRHPWTSAFHLLWILRDIVEHRLRAYQDLWREIYNDTAISGWPHIWSPCIHFDTSQERWLVFYQDRSFETLQGGLYVLHQYPLNQQHLIQYPENIRARGWDRFYHGRKSQECCAACTNTDPLDLSTGLTASVRGVQDYCRCGSLFEQQSSEFTSRVAILYAQPKPPGWPHLLLTDPGFWGLVLLEENLSAYPGVLNRLWSRILDGGLPKLLGLGDPGLNYAVGTMMAHGGQVLGRNLLEVAIRVLIDHGDEVGGSDLSPGFVQGRIQAAAEVLYAAGIRDPFGRPALALSEVTGRSDSYSTNQLPLIADRTTFAVKDDPAALNWAGMLYIETPSVLTPQERAAAALASPEAPSGRPPARPGGEARKMSIAGPLIVGGSVVAAGLLVWRVHKVRRDSSGGRDG